MSAERGLVVRAGEVFRCFPVCAPDRKASDEMRSVSFTVVGIAETIVESDLGAPVMREL